MSIKSFFIVVVAVAVSGCAAAPMVVTGLGIGSVVVSETTGKTVTDHTVSAVNGQDCKVGRALKNQDMCQDPKAAQISIVTTGVTPSTVQEIEFKFR